MYKWEQAAAESNLRIFPIKIEQDQNGKWHKKPLVKAWQDQANYYQFTAFDWSGANGYGILMGFGFYALDLDLYKDGSDAEAWFDTHSVHRETRTHKTISGGIHRIYTVPTDLPTRANIIPGLDGRGIGGFIAFGEGYEMIDDRVPSMMPAAGRENIAEGSAEVIKLEGVRAYVDGWRPPEPADCMKRLNRALSFGPRLLGQRWNGNNIGLFDKSRSAMDHSIAKLLVLAGMDEDMIVWAILTQFMHGSARWKPNPKVAVRAAARSALKSGLQVRADKAAIDHFAQPEISDAELEAMNRVLRGGGDSN
jgi:hypothetical protein